MYINTRFGPTWICLFQDECHVLRVCPLTQPVRHVCSSGANIGFCPDILNDAKVVKDIQYIYDVQRSYE